MSDSRTPEYYQELIDSVQVLPEARDQLAAQIKHLLKLDVYNIKNTPTEFIAALHYREASNQFTSQLFNGEPWRERTTRVPKGLGPWSSFKESLMEAVLHNKWFDLVDAEDTIVLKRLEGWNGFGYVTKNVHSPYLWAGSNHGVDTGKFVADGKYDPNAVDQQLGAALIYLGMKGKLDLDVTVHLGQVGNPHVKELQQLLIKWGYELKDDGFLGPITEAAMQKAFGK